ncbi:MAG: response regulator [Gaiellaceae bacterium]
MGASPAEREPARLPPGRRPRRRRRSGARGRSAPALEDVAGLAKQERDPRHHPQRGQQQSWSSKPANGLDALSLLRRGGFDLALVDMMLPELDGFELVRRIRREATLPIILLAARGEENESGRRPRARRRQPRRQALLRPRRSSPARAELLRANGFGEGEGLLEQGSVQLDLLARRSRRGFKTLVSVAQGRGNVRLR